MADLELEALENRINLLENIVFGDADKDAAYPKCVDTLNQVNTQLVSSTVGKNNIGNVMKRLEELESYLDPAQTDALTLSEEAKAEILLAEEEQLNKMDANMKSLSTSTELLSSEHIKATPSFSSKLQGLSKVHIDQQDQVCELSEQTKQLLTTYNNIITLLSRQMVQWDETVTKLEKSAQPKKTKD